MGLPNRAFKDVELPSSHRGNIKRLFVGIESSVLHFVPMRVHLWVRAAEKVCALFGPPTPVSTLPGISSVLEETLSLFLGFGLIVTL